MLSLSSLVSMKSGTYVSGLIGYGLILACGQLAAHYEHMIHKSLFQCGTLAAEHYFSYNE